MKNNHRGPHHPDPSLSSGVKGEANTADQSNDLSDRQEMDQRRALDDLKNQIEESMYALELLQREHRALAGRDHVMPFYLTDPRNRATLKQTGKPRVRG